MQGFPEKENGGPDNQAAEKPQPQQEPPPTPEPSEGELSERGLPDDGVKKK